ncbi:MAG TPA: hypothetical protein VHY48_05865 [Acidobacteriaceae bacterium]|nr:hypothetical protein [Acidobacteriaceae bacterium]
MNMGAAGDQDIGLGVAQYLEQSHRLAAELQRGMDSIAANALADFEESIANQQSIAAHLTELAKDFALPAQGSLTGSPLGDSEIAAQIQAANRHLQVLNKRYSALLRHSTQSAAQMISLLTSLKGYYRQTSGPSHQGWSCEA